MTTALIIVGLLAVAAVTYIVLRTKDEPEKPVVNNQKEVVKDNLTTEKPQKPDEKDEKPNGDDEVKKKREEFITHTYHNALRSFRVIVDIPDNCELAHYLECLTYECYYQYYEHRSNVGLPSFYLRENFPVAYDYWEKGEETSNNCFYKLVWWVFALVLSELRPDKREKLMKNAYDAADNVAMYGFSFEEDHNVGRIVGSAIYATVRGALKQFDRETMREDVGGKKLDMTVQEIYDTPSENFEGSPFWIDFREFLPAKPGPYLKGYDKPRRATYTDDEFDDFGNLEMDRQIHEYIVKNFNLDTTNENRQRTVQAIADKESASEHMFGDYKTTKHFHFHPVFGMETIQKYISPDGDIAELSHYVKCICSWSREPLQSKDTSPKEYGRLRPGCSWTEECKPNSTKDPHRNILVNFEIEENDGKHSGYYNENNEWTRSDEISSEEEYVEFYQRKLYANSYPSGHSACIMGVAMLLMEMMPDKADLILREANEFAYNRTICRYHWTSDTINGRIVGAATSAVLRAAKDFDDMLEVAKKCLKND